MAISMYPAGFYSSKDPSILGCFFFSSILLSDSSTIKRSLGLIDKEFADADL